MKLRILLVAHHMNPDWGSEPLISWRWAKHLQQHVELVIITHSRNQAAIEARSELDAEIHYIDTEKFARVVNAINDACLKQSAVVAKSILESFSLRLFDRKASKVAKKIHKSKPVDLIHRVSPISPRLGTRLMSVGVPVVVGPLNGGMVMPDGFLEVAARESNKLLSLRGLARLSAPLEPSVSSADEVIVATQQTRSALSPSAAKKTTLICENAVELDAFEPRFERHGRGLRLLCLGRLLPYKGVQFAIRALGMLRYLEDLSLTIVGQGVEETHLRRLTQDLGLEDRVHFVGAVPVEDVPHHMRNCDVFLLPSLRESGGAVVLEAMASGKPVVVFNHGGPSETVNDKVGIKVDAAGEEDLIAGFARAIESLYQDEDRRLRMAISARRHVADNYTWKKKVEAALDIYKRQVNITCKGLSHESYDRSRQ